MTSTRSLRGIRVVRFGEFELDIRAGELRRNGEKVHLQEQPFRLLAMLVEYPGEVVLREEIRKRLWPNDTVVEISHGINAAVLRLRDALGDNAEDPLYIETVARRGYRFKGVVDSARTNPAGDAPRDLTGQAVAHYKVLEKLGSGGMGIVYRAEDLKLGRHVALKFLPPELAGDPAAMARFDREARVASLLSHPNICTVYAVEEYKEQPVIVMELAEGQTLDVLLEKGPLSADRAIAIAIQLADALDAAHRKGIVHRDLKPANLLLGATGLKVLDFGLARINRPPSGEPVASHITQQGAILGTPHYMAPEQVQGRSSGETGDIFSLGLILYEMLSGCRAFDGLSSADVMAAILTAEPPLLPPAASSIELEAVVRRCLAKNPAERWQSAAELKTALESLRTVKPVKPVTEPRLRGSGLSRLLPVAIAAAAAVILTVIALIATSKQQVTRFTVNLPAPGVPRVSLAPNGRRVAFVSGGRLYARSFDSAEPRLLFSGESAGTPFWSPDGRAIAFTAGGKLRVVDADGGVASILCEVNTNLAGAWGPDGTILIGQIGDSIFRIPASGGVLTRVTTIDPTRGEARHLMASFLPGGRRFLYLSGSSSGGSMLYAASLDGPERTAVMPIEATTFFASARSGSAGGFLVFSRGSSLMAQKFDPNTLRVSGELFEIASQVTRNNAVGSSIGIAHFAVSGPVLAYATRAGKQDAIDVVQNWMSLMR